MASRRHLMQEDLKYEVLRILERSPDASVREIAKAVGASNGAAYYCVRALVQTGLVKIANFTASSNKVRYAYVLTPRGVAEKAALTVRFLRRKLDEYERLRHEIELLQREVGSGIPPGAISARRRTRRSVVS